MKKIETNNTQYRALAEKLRAFTPASDFSEVALYAERENNCWKYLFCYKEAPKSDFVFSEKTDGSYSYIRAHDNAQKCRELEDTLDEIRKSYIKTVGKDFNIFEFRVNKGKVDTKLSEYVYEILDYRQRLDLWKYKVTGITNNFVLEFNKNQIDTQNPYYIFLVNKLSDFFPTEWYELAFYAEKIEKGWGYQFCFRETKKSDFILSENIPEVHPEFPRNKNPEKINELIQALDLLYSSYRKEKKREFRGVELYVKGKKTEAIFLDGINERISYSRRIAVWTYKTTKTAVKSEEEFIHLYVKQHPEEFSKKKKDTESDFVSGPAGIAQGYWELDRVTRKFLRLVLGIIISIIIAILYRIFS